ncbi:MAG: 1-acyl-sn-glycerol-3-phosphate acyltransferase [Bacteroidia bacterium]
MEKETINYDKLIDIEKIIASKNPALLKYMPRFVINYIKRTIHQDELNEAISRNRNNFEYDFAVGAFKEFDCTLTVEGQENIPLTEGCIIASNHPLGGLDGISLMYLVGSLRKDIKFLVNDLLLNLRNYGSIFIPVNKLGKNSPEYLANIDKVYASNACVLVFPAGLCSRKNDKGEIEDLLWRKSFINKAITYKKDIIPCHTEARNSNWFYNLAYYRQKIGVKANVEMFYLADEMYKMRGRPIKFTFGKPIPWQTFTNDKTEAEWAVLVKQHVYALGGKGELVFK